jgi:hypothetical protein
MSTTHMSPELAELVARRDAVAVKLQQALDDYTTACMEEAVAKGARELAFARVVDRERKADRSQADAKNTAEIETAGERQAFLLKEARRRETYARKETLDKALDSIKGVIYAYGQEVRAAGG